MADGTAKPIDRITTGDQVLAADPTTGRITAEEVTATVIGDGEKNLYEITVDPATATQTPEVTQPTDDTVKSAANFTVDLTKSQTVTATDNHPFWLPQIREWLTADKLQPGQWLETSAGTWVQISSIRSYTQQQRVHNLTVSDLHTYYVLAGTTPVLVHNCGEIDYGSISADGRRSGIVAVVTPQMIGTGDKASTRMRPPGFVSGANGDSRGHLLPKALGGSGNTPENFVRTTAAIDNGPMNEFEKEVAEYVSKSLNTIIYSATPHYRPGSNVPFAVSLEAFDDTGWFMGKTFMQ